MTKEQALSLAQAKDYYQLIGRLRELGLISQAHWAELFVNLEDRAELVDWVATIEDCYAK